jgi:hypothetical protein
MKYTNINKEIKKLSTTLLPLPKQKNNKKTKTIITPVGSRAKFS